MSLLADLLSKVKHSTSRGDIPPNLKNIVHTSIRRSAYKRKVIFISVFSTVSIMSGILIVYYVRNLTGISEKKVDMRPVPDPQSVARAGSDQGVDTPTDIAPEVSQQIVSPPSEFREKSEGDKSVLQGSSVERIEKKLIERANAEEGQLVGVRDEKGTFTKKKEIPKDLQTPHTQVERIDVFERDAYLYAAREYELRKDYSKALSLYKKILEIDRDNVTVMNNIAYILLHLGLIEESIKYSQRAVDINKDYVPALINLGVAYIKLGDITAAEGYFKRASMQETNSQSVIFNLAIFYEKQKDYSTASEYYTELIRLGDIEGFLGLARVYENEEKTEEALKVYKNIYSLDSVDNKTRILVDQRVNILNERLKMNK